MTKIKRGIVLSNPMHKKRIFLTIIILFSHMLRQLLIEVCNTST